MRENTIGWSAFALGLLTAAALSLCGGCVTPDWLVPDDPPIIKPEDIIPKPDAPTNSVTIGKWHGPDGSNASETFRMLSASFGGGKLRMTYEQPTWDAKTENTIVCFAVKRNGVWTGGKFDWVRTGQKLKLTENIEGGYIKGILPLTEGEPCLVWLMHVAGMSARVATERSTFYQTEWHQ